MYIRQFLQIAIIENYQQDDGSIIVPDSLIKYTGFRNIETLK